jgi:anti-sigma B factor antagonist
MSLSISTRLVDDVAIIDMFGRLQLGEATSKLRDAINELLKNDYKKILLNMENVLHIDSSGIGELMGCFTSVKSHGGELKLLHLNKNVRNLLQVTRLYNIFDTHDDLAAAVKAYTL